MNKNIIKLFAILVMCFIIGGVLVACGSNEQSVQVGPVECGESCDCRTVQGIEGVQGEPGINGLTPFIGENGNWWIGETDTGVPARAENLTDCENHHWESEPIRAHSFDSATGVASTGLNILICKDCGDSKFERIPHAYTPVVTAPTCTHVGYTTYTCSCGHSYIADEVPMVAHVYSAVVTAPTCIETGYTTYTCSCGDSYVANVTPVSAHTWGAWEPVQMPDDICPCEWEQPYIHHCTYCGIEDPVNKKYDGAIGHNFNNYRPAVRDENISICEWIPMEISECANCECNDHLDKVNVGTAPGHSWSEWTISVYPTAQTKGEIVRYCTVCGNSEHPDATAELPEFVPGNYSVDTFAPTCAVEGLNTYYIVKNGQRIVVATETIPALGHVYNSNSAYAVDPAPGEESLGIVVVECACDCCNCNETVTKVLPELSSGLYTLVSQGNCLDPIDYYTYDLDIDGEIIEIGFTVNGGYTHDSAPAADQLEVVEGEGKYYWVYKCSKCGLWIVDHFEYIYA